MEDLSLGLEGRGPNGLAANTDDKQKQNHTRERERQGSAEGGPSHYLHLLLLLLHVLRPSSSTTF